MAAHAVPRQHTLPGCVTACSLPVYVLRHLLTMATSLLGEMMLGGDQEDSYISLGSSIPSSREMADYVVNALKKWSRSWELGGLS